MTTYRGKQEGILGLKLKCKESDTLIGLLANYLPPDSYLYGKDPEGFFLENSLIYSDLLDCDLVVGGGDLNSRTRGEKDYIDFIDGNTAVRINPDQEKNSHGNFFLQFLKDNRALICNGRVTPEFNDFTFLSPRGRSVPDYIYCPADHINYCTSIKVLRVSDAINKFKLQVPRTLPDHSILISEFDISPSVIYTPVTHTPVTQNQPGHLPFQPKIKKNVRKIDKSFMCSEETIKQVNQTIRKLESFNEDKIALNNIYSEIKDIFSSEIEKLPNIPVTNNKKGRRKLRKSAAFWNIELQELWETRCNFEKTYSVFKCDGKNPLQRVHKQKLLNEFKQAQKLFNVRYRQIKRHHQNRAFHELAALADKASGDPNEMWKRLRALSDHKPAHILLEIIKQDGSISKDITEVLLKWHSEFSACFKGIKDDPDLVFDDEFLEKITKLKSEFDNISPQEQESGSAFDPTLLNCPISHEEVSQAIDKAKIGKAFLFIPNEAMKNPQAKLLLHKFFNICFNSGLSPDDWLKSDLKPLFKGGDKDPRSPLDHRPLCIMSCVAKVYSCVLNNRLQYHLNNNNLLSDTQNGFRAGRSCIDHIFSLVTILRNRKLLNQETFLCFIDFRRAFDSVNHILLFNILSSDFGIVGKMYNSLKSLYSNPITRVILTSDHASYATDYFECPLGVKQGDILSPTLFSIFVHKLTVELQESGAGIELATDTTSSTDKLLVNHLIYADDLVCIAGNEADLQTLMNIVNLWCCKYRIEANLLKTEIMHVRKLLTPRSKTTFKLGNRIVKYCQKYKYLGLTLNQFLNFEQMSNSFFDPASRAMGAVICKMIKNKGFPFDIFQMLYNSCVTSISDYAHEIIGFHQYSASAKIHNRAIRSYLGVGNSAPLCAIRSEMGWPEPRSRTQVKMLRFYLRLKDMDDNRLTKKILLYDQDFSKYNPNLSTWTSELKNIISRNNLTFSMDNIAPKSLLGLLGDSLLYKDLHMFRQDCLKLPKLRTYNSLFSPFTSHQTFIQYTRLCLPFIKRKRIAQIRIGVLPIRIETDRYLRTKIPSDQRFCRQPDCDQSTHIEDELHFLIKCKQYKNLRNELYEKIDTPGFQNYTDINKFTYLLTCGSIASIVGQFIIDAFDLRPNKAKLYSSCIRVFLKISKTSFFL